MPRDDITKYLVHWTKGANYDEAFDTLRSIVFERRLRGSNCQIRGGWNCVCFTEAPEGSFHQVIGRYKPFGIQVPKAWLFERGGRPVIYETNAEYDVLPDEIKWRHVRYEPSADPPFDFSWEREWRIQVDELPLGSGAIAGTSYPIDVTGLAAALGFGRVARNSIDVSGDRDFVASFLHAASLGLVHLSRISEDFILFTSEEFGFFELADSAATGSSLMPQKKNPDPLELVRGKSGRVIGHLTGWLVTMKGLPAGYNKDLQEDKEALFDTEDTWIGCQRAVASVVGGLEPRPAVMGRAASGLLLATDVADYLVAKGLPFRDAHEVVGALVRRLLNEGRAFDQLTLDEWRQHSPLFGEEVGRAITALASVRKKRTPQSTAPGAVAAALSETREWLARHV